MMAGADEFPERLHDGSAPLPPIRILLLGGSALFRAGLGAIIEQGGGMKVIGEYDTIARWPRDADRGPPDVLLVDGVNCNGNAPEELYEIRQRSASMRVLLLIDHSDPEGIRRCIVAGASGVVLKGAPAYHLLTAIRKVHAGELWVDRATMAQIISGMVNARHSETADPERPKIESLTRREHEVVALIAAGHSNKAIAAQLSISASTVRHHLTSVYEKLGVPNRLALVVYALRHKLSAA